MRSPTPTFVISGAILLLSYLSLSFTAPAGGTPQRVLPLINPTPSPQLQFIPTPPPPTPTPEPIVISPAPTEAPAPIEVVEPAPEPVEPPPPPPAASPVLTNEIEHLVCSYDWPCLQALNIMWCESGGRPGAINMWTGTADPYDGVFGLYQIALPLHSGLVAQYGGDVFNPATNIAVAYHLWLGNGRSWYPDWACTPVR